MTTYTFIFKTDFTTGIVVYIINNELTENNLKDIFYFNGHRDTFEDILNQINGLIPKKVVLIGRTSLLKQIADYYEEMEAEIEWQ